MGSIGLRHAEIFSRRGDVSLYLCDAEISRLQSLKTISGLCNISDSFEQMLEWDLDGIIIATPESLHVSQGIQACRRNIPILLEKPVAENAEQGRELLVAARATGAKVLVGYILRHAGFMKTVKGLLVSGAIGTPVSFHIMLGAYETLVRSKSRFAPTDRNHLFGDYSHEWDYIHWFLGPIQAAVATSHQSGNLKLTQNPNIVDSILKLHNGITGTVHLDYVQRPGCRQIRLIGDRGTIEIDAAKSVVTTRLYEEDFSRIFSFSENRDDAMEMQRDHFVDVIRNQAQELVTLEESLQAVSVSDALIRSCSTGTWQQV